MKLPPDARVPVTVACEACKGCGIISNPAWDDFFDHFGQHIPSQHDAERYWNGRGLSMEPPEEVECRTCSGAGSVTRHVTLADLAEAIRAINESEVRS